MKNQWRVGTADLDYYSWLYGGTKEHWKNGCKTKWVKNWGKLQLMISLISDDMMICVFSSVLYMAPRGRSVYPPGSQGSLVAGPPDEAATRHLHHTHLL